jgi:hypothetical protein
LGKTRVEVLNNKDGDVHMVTSRDRYMGVGSRGLVGALALAVVTALVGCGGDPGALKEELDQRVVLHRQQALSTCGGGAADCWQSLDDSPRPVVHGNLLPNGRVLLWAGAAEQGLPLEGAAVLWNPATLGTSQLDLPDDLFCAHQAFLPDGRLLTVGGDGHGMGHINNHSYIFTANPANPATGSFAHAGEMSFPRWYPTPVRLGDGRVLAVSGDSAEHGSVAEVEVFDGVGTWSTVTGADRVFTGLYPGLHLLPSGEIFYTRTSWDPEFSPGTKTAYLTLTGPASGSWTDFGQQQFYDRQEGMSLVTIDTTVQPVKARVYVFGGGQSPGAPGNNNKTAEVIEFNGGIAGASWQRIADLNIGRSNLNAVALPTGKILIVGGESEGRFSPENRIAPVETYDPATNSWTMGASLNRHRGYHTSIILLPDGRVLAAGGADVVEPSMEIYTPSYLTQGTAPTITSAPATATYTSELSIGTPNAAGIESIALLSPIAVTHQTDPSQRYIKLPILSRTANSITTRAPASGNIAPPGHYMLFVVQNGIPSVGKFIQLSAGQVVPPGDVLLEAHFAAGADGFVYSDDGFRGTNQPAYASGTHVATGGVSDGALQVRVGGVNGNDITGMSGGWAKSFSLAAPTHVALDLHYRLNQATAYESDELSQVLVSLDGQLIQANGQDHAAQLRDGVPTTTDWQLYHVSLGALPAGTHTIRIGGYNNKKTDADEVTDILIDDVVVRKFNTPEQLLLAASFTGGPDAFVNADDVFRGTAQPAYASGSHLAAGGFQGGGLGVNLGGIDNTTVIGMSNGWRRSFATTAPGRVIVSFHYNLTQSPNYESDERSEVLVSVDGLLTGPISGRDYVLQLAGDGEGGPSIGAGWQVGVVDLGVLTAGWHQLAIGGYNNKKTGSTESTTVIIDDVRVTAQ